MKRAIVKELQSGGASSIMSINKQILILKEKGKERIFLKL
jgi:hypothetical protein